MKPHRSVDDLEKLVESLEVENLKLKQNLQLATERFSSDLDHLRQDHERRSSSAFQNEIALQELTQLWAKKEEEQTARYKEEIDKLKTYYEGLMKEIRSQNEEKMALIKTQQEELFTEHTRIIEELEKDKEQLHKDRSFDTMKRNELQKKLTEYQDRLAEMEEKTPALTKPIPPRVGRVPTRKILTSSQERLNSERKGV